MAPLPPRSTLFPYTTLFRSTKCDSYLNQSLTNVPSILSHFSSSNASVFDRIVSRSEERFSRNAETDLVCRLLLEKKKKTSTDERRGHGLHRVSLETEQSKIHDY